MSVGTKQRTTRIEHVKRGYRTPPSARQHTIPCQTSASAGQLLLLLPPRACFPEVELQRPHNIPVYRGPEWCRSRYTTVVTGFGYYHRIPQYPIVRCLDIPCFFPMEYRDHDCCTYTPCQGWRGRTGCSASGTLARGCPSRGLTAPSPP